MKTFVLLTTILLICGCDCGSQHRLPTKNEFIRLGFIDGKVDLTTQKHKEWYWWVGKLFTTFDVVSFDNLALEQLNMKRFFNDDNWNIFNQGEHSFYINAVDGYFAPSSRSNLKSEWSDLTVSDYFKTLQK
jgi:hypothetical protein